MKKLLALLMVFAVLLPIFATPVMASQTTRQRLAELERQRNAARTEVQGTQNLLQGLRTEMADLMAEMQRLDEALVAAAEALDDIEMALLGTEVRIEEATEDLELAQLERDIQYEVMRARLREMHESGPVGLLDVLFRAASFSDFLMRMEAVRTVSEFDQDMLQRMEAAESRVAQNIETLNREHNMIVDLQFQEILAEQALQDAMEERTEWFARLVEDEEQLDALLALQAAEQRALDEAFGVVQAQLRAEEAEAARLAREEANRRLQEEQAARTASLGNSPGTFAWPVPGQNRITSDFGPRTNPITRRQETHRGIDIGAPSGTRIIAAADGYVRLAAWHGGYGLTVIIDHAGGYSTLYAHNSRNLVSVGQRVNRGDHIANIGSTGQSTGPHLHFEIRRNGTAINPRPLVGR